MIYATIDVELADHEKAIAAGSAMYLWSWGQLWLRKHRSSNGRIPKSVAMKCPWETTAVNARALAKLIRSGLWLDDTENGIVVWNYAKKNDTRDVIEARIKSSKDKQKAYRERRKAGVTMESRLSPRDQDVTGNVTSNETIIPAVSLGAGAGAGVS